MTSKQIWNHEVTYHPEDIQDRSNSQTPDYRVYLPDTIEKLDLDEDNYVILEKKDSEEVPYLVGEKLTEEDSEASDSDSVFKIFTDGSTRLRITLSSKQSWVEEFIEFDGEDILIVGVNEIDQQFRIYKNDDYECRKQELKDRGISPRIGQPVIVPVTVVSAVTSSKDSKSLREGFGDDIDDEGPAT